MQCVSTDTLLAGKVIGVGNMSIPLPHLGIVAAVLLLLFFVLGFIFYAALFAAMGSTVSNEQDVQQASMPIMLMLVASIVFVQPILLDPTSTFSKVISWLPFSAPILMPLRMTLIQIPWYELAATLGGLFAGCVLATWLAARIYRVGMLMYGKRPTFREPGRWIGRAA
jgi:ABC-2 type transport system permease protein